MHKLNFLTASPWSAFGTDLYYEIHATSLYYARFSMTPSRVRTSFMDSPLEEETAKPFLVQVWDQLNCLGAAEQV